MSPIVYAGGAFVAPSDAKVSLFDRGYLLGDGIFETIKIARGVPVRLDAHLDRLFVGSDLTGIVPREGRARIAALAHQIAASFAEDAALRITVSRGEGPRGIGPDGFDHPQLTLIAQPYASWPRSIDTALVAAPRVALPFKTTSGIGAVLARRSISAREGLQRGVDGQLASGLVSNVFLLQGATLVTPHLASGCLPGVTRAALLGRAAGLGLVASERRVEVDELSTADEVLLTSALMGVVAVTKVDERPVKRGAWAQRLDEAIA